MNEQELRAIVRAAVARHLHPETPCAPVTASPSALPHWPIGSFPHGPIAPLPHSQEHASHVLYQGLVAVSDACVIEPAVSCDHCGYCKSRGY